MNGEYTSTIIGYVGIVCVILLPFIIIWLLIHQPKSLKSPNFRNIWGKLY